jgi:hypothetical protein
MNDLTVGENQQISRGNILALKTAQDVLTRIASGRKEDNSTLDAIAALKSIKYFLDQHIPAEHKQEMLQG